MTRGQAAWVLCFAYLVYVFLGEVPGLEDLSVFSVQAVSALLTVVFLVSSYANWGAAKATKYLVGTCIISYVIEYVGLTTGYPFGHYTYTSAMSPFIGAVPLFIPLSWSALGYFSLQATGVSVLAPAVLITLLDLSFDPIFSRTLWLWQSTIGPSFFGVPLLNYVGWFVTALVVFAVFWLVVREKRTGAKKSVIFSGGSAEGVGFYFLFGMSNVAPLVRGGIAEAAAASTILFAVAAVLLWRFRAKPDLGF